MHFTDAPIIVHDVLSRSIVANICITLEQNEQNKAKQWPGSSSCVFDNQDLLCRVQPPFANSTPSVLPSYIEI